MSEGDRSWLARLKQGLAKTRAGIVGLFSVPCVDEALFEQLEAALVSADTGVPAAQLLLQRVRARLDGREAPAAESVRTALREELETAAARIAIPTVGSGRRCAPASADCGSSLALPSPRIRPV